MTLWSIIVTTYKRPERLYETLNRILLAPNIADAEILVADDDPEGSAESVARELLAEHPGPSEYRRNEINLGVVGNVNAAIGRSSGQYIHWCADDDWPEPGFYEAMAFSDLIHCAYRNIRDGTVHKMPLLMGRTGYMNPAAYTGRLLFGNPCHMVATAFSRRLFDRLGGFDARFPYLHDWHFLIRAASLVRPFFFAEYLANYSEHDGSMTQADGSADARQAEWDAMMPDLLQFFRSNLPPRADDD